MRRPSLDPGHASPADHARCRALLRRGSHSFHAATTLLPLAVRQPVTVLYAFCRLADDGIDHAVHGGAALARLHDRLDHAYAGRPLPHPVDRAFADLVAHHQLPRGLFELLFEGFLWDVAGRSYEDLDDVCAYGVRVAGTVGALMALLMGVRSADQIARACDLGVAMQYSNIARDVGEDAIAGRLYLPRLWLAEAGIDAEGWLASPVMDDRIKGVIRRLLDEAARLYARADGGIALLPRECRTSIYAARYIYADLGRRIAANGYDSITVRAVVPPGRKLALIGRSMLANLGLRPRSSDGENAPLPAAYAPMLASLKGYETGEFGTDGGPDRLGWVLALMERQALRTRQF
ncbi:phytoene synthase [Iodidimonas nitroreducens]|uniref:Phytoene synthase n=1 Tax=Iodidimonas nitroreducens TaxID=1236968 RepID=A0A5A7NAQ9_9PROT|nr:phytoene/squalene synthase family protein [Iodidimonas nitroreducens]GAK32637.1 phytoene synthase [alpha proteobacterium Q-1]GER05332.1 phytoene synthase [Iodidimonas nitroreducens]